MNQSSQKLISDKFCASQKDKSHGGLNKLCQCDDTHHTEKDAGQEKEKKSHFYILKKYVFNLSTSINFQQRVNEQERGQRGEHTELACDQ